MAVDFTDEAQVQGFRSRAIERGKDPVRVDAFIEKKRGTDRVIQPGETLSGIARETGTTVGTLAQTNRLADPNRILAGERLKVPGGFPQLKGGQDEILPGKDRVTQAFGNRSAVEIFSGGVNRGTDFGAKRGTPVALPQGRWVVMESFGEAREGVRGTNRGYGNSVKVRNQMTGEILRFSHLGKVNVRPGQLVSSGQVVGLTGSTGNSTGPHLDIEYISATGRLGDVRRSPYGKFL